jgi:hypothetical protein
MGHPRNEVVTVELVPKDSGTGLRVTHAGFQDQASATPKHGPKVLAQLDRQITAGA